MLKHGLTYGFIQKIAVLYLVVWTLSPQLSVDNVYRLIALGCAGVWFFIWILRDNPIVIQKDQFLSVIFLIFVLFVIFVDTQKISDLIKQISMILLVICFFMNQYYLNKWDELRGIIPVVILLLIIFNFNSITALIEDPTIARRLVRDDETTYEYLRQGIGGYSLIYSQVCIFPVASAWTFKAFKNNKLYFFMGLVWLISYVWFLSLAGYSIAIFASFSGLILLIFYRGKSGVGAFIVMSAFFIITMACIMYVDSFRNSLLEFFDGTAVAKKINDLVSTGETGETGESIQVRISAYSYSIARIFKYPIIGSLWRDGVGAHSAFLDIFSKYGLFGIYAFSKCFYAVPVYYKKSYNNTLITVISNATLITLLFVSVLDAAPYSFMCIVLLVTPLFFEDIIEWSGVEKYEGSLDR